MATALQLFCDCFPPDDVQTQHKSKFYAGPVAGRLILPAGFRSFEPGANQKSYWNPLLTGNQSTRYQGLLAAALTDDFRTLIFCFNEFFALSEAMRASKPYKHSFDAHRLTWKHRTEEWVHQNENPHDGTNATHNAIEEKFANACKENAAAIASAETYADMLVCMFPSPHKEGNSLHAIVSCMNAHLTSRKDSPHAESIAELFFASTENALAVTTFQDKTKALVSTIRNVQASNALVHRRALSAYGTWCARELATYLQNTHSVSPFLSAFENAIPSFTKQLHADWPFAQSASGVALDQYAFKEYAHLVQTGRMPLETLLYYVVLALGEGRVSLTKDVRQQLYTQASESDTPYAHDHVRHPHNHAENAHTSRKETWGNETLPHETPWQALDVPCLYAPATAVSHEATLYLDDPRINYLCGRESFSPNADPRVEGQVPWRFVFSTCTDISRRHFTIAYDETSGRWMLGIPAEQGMRKLLYRPHHTQGAPTTRVLTSGESVALEDIAWFALIYDAGSFDAIHTEGECAGSGEESADANFADANGGLESASECADKGTNANKPVNCRFVQIYTERLP